MNNKIRLKNRLILSVLILLILFVLTGYAKIYIDKDEIKIVNLKYNKQNLEITGNIQSNNNEIVTLDFYDEQGYLGTATLNLSSDLRIFHSSKLNRDPTGILKIDIEQ